MLAAVEHFGRQKIGDAPLQDSLHRQAPHLCRGAIANASSTSAVSKNGERTSRA